MTWKTIDSAPRDGRRVLTYSPAAQDYGYASIGTNYMLDGVWRKTNNKLWPPTHWQPLPAPPESEA